MSGGKPDAFQKLLRASQRQQAGPASQKTPALKRPRTEQQYGTCPVCSATVPLAFLELHAADCLDGPGAGASQQTPCAGARNAGGGATPGGGRGTGGGGGGGGGGRSGGGAGRRGAAGGGRGRGGRVAPGAAATPVPATPVQAAGPLTPATPASGPAAAPAPPPQARDQQRPRQPPSQDGEGEGSPAPGPQDASPTGGGADGGGGGGAAAAAARRNAFDVLASAQRVLAQVHVFFLERRPPGAAGPSAGAGALAVRWWLKGGAGAPREPPEAAWSGACGVSLGRGGAGKAQVILATNVAPGDGVEVSWGNAALASNPGGGGGAAGGGGGGAEGGEPRKAVVSLLKSALQKNVRLGRHEEAVRVATALLKEDAGELLRRLGVICLEDALLHPRLPIIVWCMAAHAKGYRIGGTLANEVLGVVQQLAAATLRDHLPRNTGMWRMPASLSDADAQLPAAPAAAGLVKALLVRAAFGGMECDRDMLSRYAGLWLARFLGLAAPPPPLEAKAAAAAAAREGAARREGRREGQAAQGRAPQAAGPQQQQQQQAAPVAHAGAGGGLPGADGPGGGGGDGDGGDGDGGDGGSSEWLAFLEGVFSPEGLPPGVRAPRITLVTPLRKEDIPLSALDHHISELVPFLLRQGGVAEVLSNMTRGCWGHEADRRQLLERCIWAFRSGRYQLDYDLATEDAEAARLGPLWAAAAAPADRYSAAKIMERLFCVLAAGGAPPR
ncbi:MAG: hypothetical protein J3K34DRAFT_461074 [Monoraphidium minutum]|nr:MAG: hypothetical protein J3K34DRAFT_461074 [Monoraphidium minutum]